jgi:hypothetical protein
MGFPISLDQDEYEALVSLARQGTLDDEGQSRQDEARALDQWLQLIEQRNGIVRDKLWIQWQEAGEPTPVGTMFPQKWPPERREYIEMTSRRINRADVDAVLAQKATTPVNVLVTPDPGAELGWSTPENYFTR